VALTWQASLLEPDEPGFDAAFTGAARRFLGDGAWVDVVPGWATGAGALFARVMDAAPWGAHDRWMYDRMVAEPRLTTREWTAPPAPVTEMSVCLTSRYGYDLSMVSANLYRDGQDSVAWHGDRVGRTRTETVVAILSLGAARRFLLRPKGGGPSVRLTPNSGDLLVLGGTCQRTWEHCVPKCSSAGPRVSVMWRENAAM
jgi:alkylated DNA repair dioxygenase AlkB